MIYFRSSLNGRGNRSNDWAKPLGVGQASKLFPLCHSYRKTERRREHWTSFWLCLREMRQKWSRNCPMKEEEEEERGAGSNPRRRGVLSFLHCLKNRHSTTQDQN